LRLYFFYFNIVKLQLIKQKNSVETNIFSGLRKFIAEHQSAIWGSEIFTQKENILLLLQILPAFHVYLLTLIWN